MLVHHRVVEEVLEVLASKQEQEGEEGEGEGLHGWGGLHWLVLLSVGPCSE
jgi:hypothetical protein